MLTGEIIRAGDANPGPERFRAFTAPEKKISGDVDLGDLRSTSN
jgi:hypothetical protein